MPSPTLDNQAISVELIDILKPVVSCGRGRVLFDLHTGLPSDSVVRADVLVLLGDAARSTDPFDRVPALAVEVHSPSNRKYDLGEKWERSAASSPEVWLVDPEARSVQGQRPDPPDQVVRDRVSPIFAPDLVIDWPALLDEILGRQEL